jgi:hypothetical protein
MTTGAVRPTVPKMTRAGVLATVMLVAVSALSLGGRASALTLFPNCSTRETAQTFAPWNDPSSYFPMTNGGFESGSDGWSVSGAAAVVSGNETYFVAGATDSHSLAISNTGRASSPATCVAAGENSVRLFVKSSGSGESTLHVQAFVRNSLTGLVLATAFDIDASDATSRWAPTDVLVVPNLLGGLAGAQSLTLVFTTRGASTVSWNVDDVYVDPFKLR